jgi:CheY-like chemotaxis protein
VDLILLDYEMPSMDGPTVFRMLKEDNGTRNIPVMFLTGKNDRDLVVKAVDMRPEDYILKSIPKKDLMDKLEDFFKRYKEKMVKLTESD